MERIINVSFFFFFFLIRWSFRFTYYSTSIIYGSTLICLFLLQLIHSLLWSINPLTHWISVITLFYLSRCECDFSLRTHFVDAWILSFNYLLIKQVLSLTHWFLDLFDSQSFMWVTNRFIHFSLIRRCKRSCLVIYTNTHEHTHSH